MERRCFQQRKDLKSSKFYTDCKEKLKMLVYEVLNHKTHLSEESIIEDSLQHLSLRENHTPNTTEPQDLTFVCYGIGNIASCLIAQYQLSLCMALREDLNIEPDKCFIYDPVFTDQHKKLLQELKFVVIPVNEEGKRPCLSPTIVLMPHCGKALYNNFLWSNWMPDRLTNVILLGNSFSAMVERTPRRILKETGSYILKVLEYLKEVPLSDDFHLSDVFNDLSLHHFLSAELAPMELWESREEPVYNKQEAEIIFK